MSFCSRCGTSVEEGMPFCGGCGAAVASDGAGEVESPAGALAGPPPGPAVVETPAPAETSDPGAPAVEPQARRRRPWLLVFLALILLVGWAALTWWVVPRLTALEVSVATLHAITSDDRDYLNTTISESTRSAMRRADFEVSLVTARHLLAVGGWSSLDVSAPGFTIIDGSEFGVEAVSALGTVNIPVSVALSGKSATCVAELRGTGNAVTIPVEIRLDRKLLGWSVKEVHIDNVAVIGQ